MKIGITIGLGARSESTIEGLVGRAAELESQGFATVWMANAFGFDALTAFAAVAGRTSRIGLGTAVVPTFPRHPVVMAQQALTLQDASGGRFTLGVGLSHKVMMEDALGIAFERPAKHMREYLDVLEPLLAGKPASFRGELYRTEASLAIPGAATPVPLLLAALGPEMLRLAGGHADGTITSWVGPKTFESHIVPVITGAAREAGRDAPRIVAGLPIALTDDAGAARAQLAQQATFYNELPSYRAMLDREGVAGPADVALIGDEAALDAGLRRLEDAGVTEFAAQVISPGPGVASRTVEWLAARG